VSVRAERNLKKRDEVSVSRDVDVLQSLGCPDVRRGEGSEEWANSKGAYRFTPDVIAGPLVGGGDPSDFYIDVFEPRGDQYVKPMAGNPHAASILLRAVAEQGAFNLADMKDTGEQLLKPMNDKIGKYVGSRANTPMFGLAMYFTMTGNQYVGRLIAALQATSVLDGAFGVTAHLGQEPKDRFMHDLLSPGQSLAVFGLPIEQPVSFVLYVAEKIDGPRILLLVNRAVQSRAHPFGDHDVIRWLRGMRDRTATLRADAERRQAGAARGTP
jgi:hypothetical protein